MAAAAETIPQGAAPKQNRAEKKARKVLQKLGLIPCPQIMRVTIKKDKSILFVIQNPDVYKSSGSDTYIIFGEAKIEDLGAQQQAAAAEQFKTDPVVAEEISPEVEEEEIDDADIDTTDLLDNDIQMVMDQSGVSKAKAVAALRSNDNDIVNAIMDLTL